MPLVSVIIPTYNRARPLEQAIRSVLLQSFSDFECIVVDDGSTDGTRDAPVLKEDDRLRFVRLEVNGGVSRARNTGAALAIGRWLAFLDSDDRWHPEKLACQVEWTRRNPGFRIVQTTEIWIRNGVRVNPPKTHEKKAGYIFEPSLARCMITPSSVMLERSLLAEAAGFNETLPACEDYDLWLRITARYPVGLIDELLLTRYGGQPDQLSSSVFGLDRFRIRSMMDLERSDVPDDSQRDLVRKEIVRKARIVADGYRKRGNLQQYDNYEEIRRIYDR